MRASIAARHRLRVKQRRQTAVDLLPARETLLGNADLPTEIADGRGLLQHRGDLLDRETLLHGTPPGSVRTDCAAKSPWKWPEKPGAPQELVRVLVTVSTTAAYRCDRRDGLDSCSSWYAAHGAQGTGASIGILRAIGE